MFQTGNNYTRAEIHTVLGGNQQTYLPLKAGVVVAACLRLDLNPGAPKAILCGSGPNIRQAGEMLSRQTQAVRVFIKRKPGGWEYQGLFRVAASFVKPADCAPYVVDSGRDPAEISRVVLLEPV